MDLFVLNVSQLTSARMQNNVEIGVIDMTVVQLGRINLFGWYCTPCATTVFS